MERKLNSLKGKKVGIIRGFSYGEKWAEFLKEGTITIEESNKMEHIFKKLNSDALMLWLAIFFPMKMDLSKIK